MFETEKIPVYVERIGSKRLKIGADEFKGIDMVLKIEPLTRELANELGVKSKLFRRDDSEPDRLVDGMSFTLNPKPQTIEIFSAEDMDEPALKILEAKVSKFRVSRASGDAWSMKFNACFAEISGNDLLMLKEAVFETRWLSFADTQGGLFEEAEAEERRESPDAKPVKRRASLRVIDEPRTH